MAEAKRRKPADMVMDDREYDQYTLNNPFMCPKCGQKSFLAPGDTKFAVGRIESDYVCTNYIGVGGKQCGFRLRTVSKDPGVVWVSPNGRWYIYDPSKDTSGTRYTPSVVNMVYATEGDAAYWSSIYDDGRIAHDNPYGVPKYVLDKVESILKKRGYTQWRSDYNERPVGKWVYIWLRGNGPKGVVRVQVPGDPRSSIGVFDELMAYDLMHGTRLCDTYEKEDVLDVTGYPDEYDNPSKYDWKPRTKSGNAKAVLKKPTTKRGVSRKSTAKKPVARRR